MSALKYIAIGAGGLAVLGYAYSNAVDNLAFAIQSIEKPDSSGDIQVILSVTNPSWLSFPIPSLSINVFDASNNFIGTIINQTAQLVQGNGISYLQGTVSPNYGNLVSLLANAFSSGNTPTNLTFDGQISVGPFDIPFTTEASLALGI